jgi:hypothetical protein
MHAWLEAWEKLELDEEREPGRMSFNMHAAYSFCGYVSLSDTCQIRGRIPQFRGQLQDHAK